MNLVYEALSRVTGCLSDFEVRFALIGGLAVSARSEPRFTRDVDLIVEAHSDGEAERLIHSLLGRGYGIHAQLEQKTAKRRATCRLFERANPDGVIIDLFFANFGIEDEVLLTASEEEIAEGISLPIVQAEDLIALKLLAVSNRNRPRDIGRCPESYRTHSGGSAGKNPRTTPINGGAKTSHGHWTSTATG
jgi:predicted nucleotidyltransferase